MESKPTEASGLPGKQGVSATASAAAAELAAILDYGRGSGSNEHSKRSEQGSIPLTGRQLCSGVGCRYPIDALNVGHAG
jgi:hypothetical protein